MLHRMENIRYDTISFSFNVYLTKHSNYMATYQETKLIEKLTAFKMQRIMQTSSPLSREELSAGGFSTYDIAELVRLGLLPQEF